jgi:hypothetical protein
MLCFTTRLFWQAIQMDPDFAKNIGQIVLLGGSFAVNGNVNPAAEANVCISILYSYSFYYLHKILYHSLFDLSKSSFLMILDIW